MTRVPMGQRASSGASPAARSFAITTLADTIAAASRRRNPDRAAVSGETRSPGSCPDVPDAVNGVRRRPGTAC